METIDFLVFHQLNIISYRYNLLEKIVSRLSYLGSKDTF